MNDLRDEVNEREAAEDYRRQRQEADARKSGFAPMRPDELQQWLIENEALIHQIATANSISDQDVTRVVDEYKRLLAAMPVGSSFDDLNGRFILSRLINEIEDVCRNSQVPIRNGVVFGISPELGAAISQANVPGTDVSIIAASSPFIVLCNLVSRVFALSLPHTDGPLIAVSNEPAQVRSHLTANPHIVRQWQRLISHYAVLGWPPGNNLSTIPSGPAQGTRILILRALELFAVAHEYGHHVMRHGVLSSSEDRTDILHEEHEADIFGRLVSMVIVAREPPPNPYAMTGLGAVIILGALDLVRRARTLLETGTDQVPPNDTHPPFAERIAMIAPLDDRLPTSLQAAAPIMRDSFVEILEIVWELIRPKLFMLRERGVRPRDPESRPGGWLPA